MAAVQRPNIDNVPSSALEDEQYTPCELGDEESAQGDEESAGSDNSNAHVPNPTKQRDDKGPTPTSDDLVLEIISTIMQSLQLAGISEAMWCGFFPYLNVFASMYTSL